MRSAATVTLSAAPLLCLFDSKPHAGSIEITQNCYGGICFESAEAFMPVAVDPVRRTYRFRFSRTQSVLYAQVGAESAFPPCAPLCETRHEGGEARAFQPRTGRLLARLLTGLAGCDGRPVPPVMLHVYDASLNPEWMSVSMDCPR